MTNESQPVSGDQKRIRGVAQPKTQELPVVPGADVHESPITRPRPKGTRTATLALALIGLGVTVGVPLLNSLKTPATVGAAPPGSTDTLEPQLTPSPSGETGKKQQSEAAAPQTPPRDPSVCETQTGTYEAQLPDGEPVLPATTDRPSVFVISPDRSGQQSFSIRPADESGADWNTVYERSDVGIVGITTADIRFSTSGGLGVWGKSCAPTSRDAIQEAASRASDLCHRREFGLKEVVVYQVDANGKPEMIGSRKC